MGLGLTWDTDTAVSIVGGGKVSQTGSMNIDFMAKTVTNQAGWSPRADYIFPVFTTNAKVTWNPIMRTAFSIGVSVFNAPYGPQPVTITSSTSFAYQAALSLGDGQCPWGQLKMTSYSDISNKVTLPGVGHTLLSKTNGGSQPRCFNIPNSIPSISEVDSLRSVGADFCTSYLQYSAPTTVSYAILITAAPTTTQTTVTTTITTQSTQYLFPTIISVTTETVTGQPTSYLEYSGVQSISNTKLLKRDQEIPFMTTLERKVKAYSSIPTPAAMLLEKRLNVGPAMIRDWDSKKVSMACAQIATGTNTVTFFTSTSTSYTSTTTVTIRKSVDVLGSIVTSTYPVYFYSTTSTKVTSGDTTAISTPTSCPLQQQISCFTLTGHGRPHIDGKRLYLQSIGDRLIFGDWGSKSSPTQFYLSCNGYLIAHPAGIQMIKIWGNPWPGFMSPDTIPSHAISPKCVKDIVTKTLVCDEIGLFSEDPDPLAAQLAGEESWWPKWYNYGFWQRITQSKTPLVLTYDDVSCTCSY
jgi:hypothetical protein